MSIKKIKRKLRKRAKRRVLKFLTRMPNVRWHVRTSRWDKHQKHYEEISRGLPINSHMVVFQSFGGRQYSCSPRAIYEKMCADPRFDDWTLVWALSKKAQAEMEEVPSLERAEIVTYNSRLYKEALAQAKYWIYNNRVQEFIYPKKGQVYVQCWHGTPLKHLGFDVDLDKGGALNTADELARRFRIDSEKWTYLLSPSEYTSEHLADAFGLPQEERADVILEEGYPRNDVIRNVLDSKDCNKRIEELKEELEIPKDKKVLLLAPTWREDQCDTSRGYVGDIPVDMDAMQEQLGDEWIVLLRMHYYIANKIDLTPWEGFAFNVSGARDINKLYLVSDALCTDYSSVFFDYSNTGRPLIFLWTDRDHYENDLHGFYVELDSLPGPKCSSTQELIDEVKLLLSWEEKYGKDYAAFREKFCPKDDGHATERVIERIIKEV